MASRYINIIRQIENSVFMNSYHFYNLIKQHKIKHNLKNNINTNHLRTNRSLHTAVANRDVINRAIELAIRSADTWSIEKTDFIPPNYAREAVEAIGELSDVVAIANGGYPQAERCRIITMREELYEAHRHDIAGIADITALKINGNFMMIKAEHGDFLGAILGTGIKRDVLGDIIVLGDSGAYVFTTLEIADFLMTHLKQVRSVKVEIEKVLFDDLKLPVARVKEIDTVEASMRLDAVSSAGFGLSRDKMADKIKTGNVKVNWEETDKPTILLKEGDIVSCSGKGRIEIKKIIMTKKLRYRVHMIKYT